MIHQKQVNLGLQTHRWVIMSF